MIAGEKIVKYLLIVIVALTLLIFMPSLIRESGGKVLEWGYDLFGIPKGIESQRTVAITNFENAVEKLNQCRNANTQGCFCDKEELILPSGFGIDVENENENIALTLKDRSIELKKQAIGNSKACVIAKDGKVRILDDTLVLKYSEDTFFEYKRDKFDFIPSLFFFKNNVNEICILEKKYAEERKEVDLCSQNTNQKT